MQVEPHNQLVAARTLGPALSTAARIAVCLVGAPQTVRRALSRSPRDSIRIVRGVKAAAWMDAGLPEVQT
jgi:hypothetical protein